MLLSSTIIIGYFKFPYVPKKYSTEEKKRQLQITA